MDWEPTMILADKLRGADRLVRAFEAKEAQLRTNYEGARKFYMGRLGCMRRFIRASAKKAVC